jgi:hypothetical protein
MVHLLTMRPLVEQGKNTYSFLSIFTHPILTCLAGQYNNRRAYLVDCRSCGTTPEAPRARDTLRLTRFIAVSQFRISSSRDCSDVYGYRSSPLKQAVSFASQKITNANANASKDPYPAANHLSTASTTTPNSLCPQK